MTTTKPSPAVTAKRYRFAHCMLDISRRELQVDGQPIALQARTFDLLAYLVRHPGQALSKEALIAAPGIPLSLDAEAAETFKNQLVHDMLDIGTATMQATAL